MVTWSFKNHFEVRPQNSVPKIPLADKIDSEGKLATMRPEWTNGSMVEIKDKNDKVLLENYIE